MSQFMIGDVRIKIELNEPGRQKKKAATVGKQVGKDSRRSMQSFIILNFSRLQKQDTFIASGPRSSRMRGTCLYTCADRYGERFTVTSCSEKLVTAHSVSLRIREVLGPWPPPTRGMGRRVEVGVGGGRGGEGPSFLSTLLHRRYVLAKTETRADCDQLRRPRVD